MNDYLVLVTIFIRVTKLRLNTIWLFEVILLSQNSKLESTLVDHSRGSSVCSAERGVSSVYSSLEKVVSYLLSSLTRDACAGTRCSHAVKVGSYARRACLSSGCSTVSWLSAPSTDPSHHLQHCYTHSTNSTVRSSKPTFCEISLLIFICISEML